MPTYGGSSIFGRSVKFVTEDLNLERQENAFPGLNGVESLTVGERGLYTNVTGLLVGATASDLGTAESTFRSYRDGIARTLVDSYSASWSNVVLESFNPQGRIRQDPSYGYLRPYSARFRHLTSS